MKQKIVTSKEFRRNKRRLIAMERTNYDRIIMLPRTGEKSKDKNWYEIAENSALLYYHEVCEALGETVNFSSDIDSYYDRYEVGLICMNGATKLRLLLKKAGLYGGEGEEGEYYVFRLKQKFSEGHMRELRRKEFARRKANNEIIEVHFVDPDLYIWLRETAEKLHKICNEHFARLDRETTGKRMVILADKIINNYQKLSLVKKDDLENKLLFWQTIYRDMRDLIYEVQTAVAVKVMSSGDAAKICDYLRRASKKVKVYHNNLAQEIRNKNNAANKSGRSN